MDATTQHQNDPSRILEQARQHLEALKQAGLSREALIALLEEDDQPKQQQQLQIQLQAPPAPPQYQPPPPPSQQQQPQQHSSPQHSECKNSDRPDAIRVITTQPRKTLPSLFGSRRLTRRPLLKPASFSHPLPITNRDEKAR
jgi:hypothetical protein